MLIEALSSRMTPQPHSPIPPRTLDRVRFAQAIGPGLWTNWGPLVSGYREFGNTQATAS